MTKTKYITVLKNKQKEKHYFFLIGIAGFRIVQWGS